MHGFLLLLLLFPGLQEKKEIRWPKFKPAEEKAFLTKLSLYKKLAEDKAAKVGEEVVAFGKAGVPYLLRNLPKTKKEIRPRLLHALDALTGAEDTDLLLREASSKKREIRFYVVRRAAGFSEKKHAKPFEAMLGDKDADIQFYASLGAARAGSVAALTVLRAQVDGRWGKHKHEIFAALHGIRGEDANARLLAELSIGEKPEGLSAMRLLGGAGTKKSVRRISTFLDSKDNRFKEEAVNALRGIMENQPPLADLSVFDLIDRAKAWKKKVGGG